jgi:hypothetical protein
LIFFALLIDVGAQLLQLVFIELAAAILVEFAHQIIDGCHAQHRKSLRIFLAKSDNLLLGYEVVACCTRERVKCMSSAGVAPSWSMFSSSFSTFSALCSSVKS